MTSHYPIVLEHEQNGTVSAYVVGLPGVFAAADTERAATAAIRKALAAHLTALRSLPVKVRQVRYHAPRCPHHIHQTGQA